MPSIVRSAIFLCVLLLAIAARATPVAEPRWVQQRYGSIEGLPVGSASSGQIDSDGFLWLATHDGLARFDGERFEVHESMRFPAMSGNRVQTIHKDSAGRLYAHTEHGDWLSIRSGHIERAPMGAAAAGTVRHVDPDSLCLTTARALHCPDGDGGFPLRLAFPSHIDAAMALPASDGTVWLIASNGDIWRHHAGEWLSLWHPGVREPGIAQQNVGHVRGDGSFWAAVRGNLLRVRPDGTVTLWNKPDDPQNAVQIREDRDGSLWIGAANGLYRVDDGGPQRVLADAAALESMYLSWRAPDGALWVRAGHGLWRFERLPDADALSRTPVLRSRGIILDLLFDADDTVWVMSLRDGIHRLNRARVKLLDEADGIGNGNVYGVSRDPNGTLWLGTLGDGLIAVDRDDSVRRYGRDSGLPGDNPWVVASAPDGGIYAGTVAPGLWYRKADSAQFQPVALPEELQGEQVLAIAFDAEQRMWLGTTAGAWLYDAAGWQRKWPDVPRRVRVSALAFSDVGDVWFGGSDGVWRQHEHSTHAVAESMLAQTSVRDLYRTTHGDLWVSTDGRGLIRVAAEDPLGLDARRLGRDQGLPSNSPHAVRQDANGHLWVNSNQGIFRIAHDRLLAHLADPAQRLSPLVLGLSDGLTDLEGNGGVQPAAAFDVEGRLWFPSQRGIVRFDPLAIPLRTRPPQAVIDGLESEGRTLRPTSDSAFPLGVRSVLIRYGAADLHAGQNLRFRYRLLPQDQGWTDASGERLAGFARLAPGDYRFEVLAGNSDGVWAQTPATLAFRVPYRWHETGLFHILLAVGFLLLMMTLVQLRLRRLRWRAIELDRQVDERTDELRTEKGRVERALVGLSQAHSALAETHEQIEDRNQQLADQAQRLEALDRFRSRVLADVSHELRTPVMLVSLPLRELHAQSTTLNETERRRLTLSLTQLDRLGSLVEQLIGLVQAESGQLRLRLRRIDLHQLLDGIVAAYQPAASRHDVALTLQADREDCVLFADRDHLLTVFGNLIDNALKYVRIGGRIDVRLSSDVEHARVTVQDDGTGFNAELATRLFERFFRADGPPRHGREGLGIGLALARELVELHGGRIAARSEPGAGATFQVDLPLGSTHVALDDLALGDTGLPSITSAAPSAVAGRGEGRILLVEDHPDLAAYLAERLADHLPVHNVDSAERALDVLAGDNDIRLVISDVVLPGLSGLELCRLLRDRPDAPPLILISAKAAESDRSAGLDAGAVAYLAKPFSFESLLDAIAAAWPAAASRFALPPADPDRVDALLQIGLRALGDAQFSIAAWADHAHLSERQLRRRVTELTGQSPQTWLREQRLLRVRHLIRSGECRTLAEAGLRCGFDNPAWLYRSYRARFGER